MAANPAARLDKWLWTTRVFKTRALAAAACSSGKVTVNGLAAKPSRTVQPEDLIIAETGVLTRTVKVIGVPKSRIGAALVKDYSEDRTPASEYEKAREKRPSVGYRPPGSGRPTKRDRRILQSYFGLED